MIPQSDPTSELEDGQLARGQTNLLASLWRFDGTLAAMSQGMPIFLVKNVRCVCFRSPECERRISEAETIEMSPPRSRTSVVVATTRRPNP